MSAHAPPVPRLGAKHPRVRSRQAREVFSAAVMLLVALVAGLAITIEVPHPNPLLLFGGLLGAVCLAYLVVSPRYEITLTLLALFLGLLNGPIKLESPGPLTSVLRDVVIFGIVAGMLMRLIVRRERLTLPPLSPWVIAFVAFVLAEALNPHSISFLKSLGGYRQQLEFVPFFFFGYIVVRDKERLRKLFVLLGVIALANGLVGAVQSRMSPSQLASWGPGYRTLAYGGEENGLSARTYVSEGEARVRPPALGSDAGFGGGVGALTLPMLLALVATAATLRRRLWALLFCAGAVLGVASSASRTSTVIAVLSILTFAAVAVYARARIGRAVLGFLALAGVVMVVVSLLGAYSGSNVFARQASLSSVQEINEHGGSGKTEALSELPQHLLIAPFGFGLGISGAAGGFGGAANVRIEGQKVSGGSGYEILAKEVGAPGLLLWLGLTINALVLAFGGLRRIADVESRTLLAGLLASFIGLTLEGFTAPTLIVTVGLFAWLSCGIIAWWFGSRPALEDAQAATP
jgi:hypothetical protein